MEETYTKIAKGAGILFIGSLISKALTYIYRLIVARYLGSEPYGLLSIGLAVLGFASVFAGLGISHGVLRYISHYKGKKDEKRVKGTITSAIKIILPLSIIFGILLFAFSGLISNSIFHNPELSIIIKILALGMPFTIIYRTLIRAFYGFQKPKYVFLIDRIFQSVALVGVTLILFILGMGLLGAAIGYIASLILSFAIAFYVLEKKVYPFLSKKIKSLSVKKELLNYSWPLAMTGLLMLIINYTDTLMLGFFKTMSDVGIYNAAIPTANLLSMIPLTIMSLFIAMITNLYAQKKHQEFKNLYNTIVRWIFYSNFFIFTLMIVFSKQMLNLLFGWEYVIGSASLAVLSIGYFIRFSLSQPSDSVLKMQKKTKAILVLTIITAVLNVVLNFWLIPIHGILGAAIASTSSLIVVALLTIIYTYKVEKVLPFSFDQIKAIIATGISVGIIYIIIKQLLPTTPPWALIPGFAVAATIYIGLLFLFKAIKKEDKDIIYKIKRKMKIFG